MKKKILLIALLSSVSLSLYPVKNIQITNNTNLVALVNVKGLSGWRFSKKMVPKQTVLFRAIPSVRAIGFDLLSKERGRRSFTMDKKFTGGSILKVSLDGWKKVSGTFRKAGAKVESFIWP